MSRRLYLSLVLCLLAVAPSAPLQGQARPVVPVPPVPPVPPSYQPLHSAIVRIHGPSVAEQASLAETPIPAGAKGITGQRFSPGDLAAAEARVARAQAPLLAAAEQLGLRVVDRYTTALNGLLVHGTAAQLAALGRLPGVAGVEAAPQVWPTRARAVPYLGAARLADEAGFRGAGTVVAVIDTGVDYTHTDFGGPGSPEAFNLANQNPERIDDLWEGQPLFPSPQVIGGWDFVGSRYTSPAYCSAGDEAAGRCRGNPAPDPDPLDERSGNWADGHGSHVAGIVAGLGVPSTPPGMAPGAKLVALKVFGLPAGNIQPDAPADVLVSAFEWCVRVNLGLAVPGTAPERVDVINMSLGGWYDAGGLAYRQALAAARDAGIVVVAAIGNDGDVAFIANGPGTAPEALSVASAALGVPWTYSPDPALRRLGAISSFSGRGPGANGSLKPDLTAPGQGIISTAMGRGTDTRPSSGTSMATPLVAGAAALLVERNQSEGLGLSATELGALLMNQAQFGIPGGDGQPAPLNRQGAGLVDSFRAGRAAFVATAGDTASLNLGALSVVGPTRLTEEIIVRSLADAPFRLSAHWAPRTPASAERGLRVTLPEAALTLPPRGTGRLTVTIDIDDRVGGLSSWDEFGRGAVIDEARLSLAEVDGRVVLTAEGLPDPAPATAGLPLYALPRAASALRAVAREEEAIVLENASAGAPASGVRVLHIPAGAPHTDPDEPDVDGALDIRHAAGIFGPREALRWLEVVVALAAPLAVPQLTSLEVYLDTDADGQIDYRARSGPDTLFNADGDPERMRVGIVAWDEAAGAPAGNERLLPGADIRIYSQVIGLRLPLETIGLGAESGRAPGPIHFYVVHRGLNERWRPGPEMDIAPDGADQAGGERFVADLTLTEAGPYELAPGQSLRLTLPAEVATLLALYPSNRFEPAGLQFQLLPPGPILPRSPLHLPFAGKP